MFKQELSYLYNWTLWFKMDQEFNRVYSWDVWFIVDQFCFGEGSGCFYKQGSDELRTRYLQSCMYWFFTQQTCLAHFIGPGI